MTITETRARRQMSDQSRGPRRHLAAASAALLLTGFAAGGATTASAATPSYAGAGRTSTTAAAAEEYGRMMLVLDSSGSMKEPAAGGQTKIQAAKSALGQVISDLPGSADVGLRVFGATVFSKSDAGACTDSQEVVKPGSDNRAELRSAVASYKPFGETPIAYALQQAAKDIGGEGRRSIVLVSDGEATCRPDPCDVAAEIAAQGIDLTVDVVGLGVSGQARQQLQCIAEKGNGTYYDVDSAAEITQSLSRVVERAVRPFTVSGRPIRGGTEQDPTPITVGDWSDRLAPKQSSAGEVSYVFRKKAGTTLRVSAVTPGDVGEWDGVQTKITPLDDPERNYSCDTSIDYRSVDTTSVIGVESVAGEKAGSCDGAGRYLITVSRWLIAPATVPIGIRVTEEPVVEDVGTPASETKATATAPQVTGAARPVTGGSSFGDAAEVGPGSWSSTIVPGEAQMFRVPLTFGQGLRVRISFPIATAAVREKTGSSGPFVAMRTYNPMRAGLASSQDSTRVGSLPGGAPLTLVDGLPPISRDLLGTDGSDLSLAGDYYIGLSVARTDETYEVPYTLDVEVTGTKGIAPSYADGATWQAQASVLKADGGGDTEESGGSAGKGTEGSAGKRATGSTAESAGGISAPVKLVSAGGLGLVAIGCLVGAVLLLRPRRT